jgi:hypothetical protein
MKKQKTGMREFSVSIPIAGRVIYSVNAESEEAAIEAAWDKFNEGGVDSADDIEWEAFDHITEGNICHAPYNDVEADD